MRIYLPDRKPGSKSVIPGLFAFACVGLAAVTLWPYFEIAMVIVALGVLAAAMAGWRPKSRLAESEARLAESEERLAEARAAAYKRDPAAAAALDAALARKQPKREEQP
jgi:membrane protein implicated in regulation of membrane protease activity